MRQAIRSHLPPAKGQEAVDMAEAIDSLSTLYGWKVLEAAIELQIAARVKELTTLSVRDSAAEYERTIGEIRGLQLFPQLIEGIRSRAAEEAPND